MAILFKKQVRKFQTGGVNPYKQKQAYGDSQKYMRDLINTSNPGAITDVDNGYGYAVNPNKEFVSGFNTRGDAGVYGGSDDDVMFSVTRGSQYVPGLNKNSGETEYGNIGDREYVRSADAKNYDITVGQYKANPNAFQNMGDGHDFKQYNSYLNGVSPQVQHSNIKTGGNYVR